MFRSALIFAVVVVLALAADKKDKKTCSKEKLTKIRASIPTPPALLTGRALVEHINRVAKWKAELNEHFVKEKLPVLKLLAGVKPDVQRVYAHDRALKGIQSDYSPPFFDGIKDSDIPASFDSRERWPECAKQIDKVQDQSLCGSCWAVSATTALADRFCIKSNGLIQVDLSASALLSCCSDCGVGCIGGYPSRAYTYINEQGVVSGGNYTHPTGCQNYPFPPCEHGNGGEKGNYPVCYGRLYKPKKCVAECRSGYAREYDADKYYVLDSYAFQNSPKSIQKELMTNGPLVFTALRMYEDFLYYRSGVYEHKAGRFLGLHAIRVIGWGEEDGTPYWLVANSWNRDWGADGFFKIRRGNNECGIESVADVGLPDMERSAGAAAYAGTVNELDC